MLTLGIPSSRTTAILLGLLTHHNLTPGPGLFRSQPDLVWALVASLFIGNFILPWRLGLPMAPLTLGLVLGKILERILRRALSLFAGEVSRLWSSPISIVL